MVNSLGQLFLVTLAVLPFLSGCDVSDIPDVLHAFDSRCFPLAGLASSVEGSYSQDTKADAVVQYKRRGYRDAPEPLRRFSCTAAEASDWYSNSVEVANYRRQWTNLVFDADEEIAEWCKFDTEPLPKEETLDLLQRVESPTLSAPIPMLITNGRLVQNSRWKINANAKTRDGSHKTLKFSLRIDERYRVFVSQTPKSVERPSVVRRQLQTAFVDLHRPLNITRIKLYPKSRKAELVFNSDNHRPLTKLVVFETDNPKRKQCYLTWCDESNFEPSECIMKQE